MHKVLVIDDEPAYQQILRDAFEKQQFQVLIAPDGKQGIIQAAKTHPDFILLDLMMPGMDGVTALRHIKQVPGLEHTPVAILTALPESVPKSLEDNQMVFKDVVGYWVKGQLTLHTLVKQVTDYLYNHATTDKREATA